MNAGIENMVYLLCSNLYMQFNTVLRILADEHPELADRRNFLASANRYKLIALLFNLTMKVFL